jgi:hypothetical protein
MKAPAGEAVRLSGQRGVPGADVPPAPADAREGGRAAPLGLSRPLALGTLGAAVLIALAAVLLFGGGAGAPAAPSAVRTKPLAAGAQRSSTAKPLAVSQHARYGGLPTWLPKTKTPVHRVLNANVAHPALSIEGEAISVSLAGAHVLATAVGPEVPEQGRFPVPSVTPVKFIVTFASATHALPLAASAFKLIDEQGKAHRPKLTALGGGAAPKQIVPGRPVSVILHDILPTGDGGLVWTPEGARPTATWDYTVEID